MNITKIDRCAGFVTIGAFAFLFLVVFILVSLLGTYLPILTGSSPWAVFRVPTEWFLSLFGTDIPDLPPPRASDETSYDQVIGTAFGVTLAVFTVLLTVIPTVDRFRYRSRLRKQAEAHREELEQQRTVKIKPIEGRDGGIDTLETLLNGCDEAIIFAGDFDWILKKDSFRDLVVDLAANKKITFVSNKERSDIAKALESDPDARGVLLDRFVYRSDERKILFTYVWYGGNATACCSLVTHDPWSDEPREENIIVHSSKPDSNVLLGIFEHLSGAAALKAQVGTDKPGET